MNSLIINRHKRGTLLTVAFLAVVVLLLPTHVTQAGFIGDLIYQGFVVNFLGSILWLAGLMLNYAINEFVLGFGQGFLQSYGQAVDTLWSVVRDIFNLTFIFGLVYIGFKMILRSDDSSARKWLVQLILAALLVNFSLFITKFVIDFSNILAVEIVNLGLVPNTTGQTVFRLDSTGTNVDMASRLQELTNMPTTFSTGGDLGDDAEEGSMFFLIFGTALVYLVSTFVFFSAAILLIIRAVVLIILMILSPFLFIGWVLPNLQSVGSKLWKMLFSRAFFAPVYIAFLFITFTLAGALTGNLVYQDFGSAFSSSDSTAAANAANDTFGPFIIITVLMITSLVAAQKMGMEGASSAIKVGKRMSNGVRRYSQRKAGDVAFGGAAKVGRSVIGGRADERANSTRYKQLAKADGIKGWYGRQRMKTAKSLADRSFDARNVGGLGKATGLGTGKKGGYATRQKEDEKEKKQMAQWIGTAETEGLEGEINKAKKEEEMRQRAELHSEIKDLNVDQIDDRTEFMETVQKDAKSNIRKAKAAGKDEEAKNMQDQYDITERLIKQAKELKAEKQEIATLEAQIAEQPAGSATQKGMERTIEQKRGDIANRDQEYLKRGSLDDASMNAKGGRDITSLTNEVKYQDQMDYIEALKDTQEFMDKLSDVLSGKSLGEYIDKQQNALGGGLSGGSYVAAGAGGAILGAGATAGMAANYVVGDIAKSTANTYKQSIEGLIKELGQDAQEMARKDKENKARKQFAQTYKEVTDEDTDTNKPDETSKPADSPNTNT